MRDDQDDGWSRGRKGDTIRQDEGKSLKRQHVRNDARHGNYPGYYGMRREAGPAAPSSGSRERRAEAIAVFLKRKSTDDGMPQHATPKRMLDIGCNAGILTLDLAQILQAEGLELVVGVDLDQQLVRAARRASKGRGFPFALASEEGEGDSLRALGTGRHTKASAEGPKKRIRLDERQAVVRLLHADWTALHADNGSQNSGLYTQSDVQELAVHDKEGYDLITALSVAKWVHIDHGDRGLRRFFARIASCLHPLGILIIEIQPYKSYKHTLKVTAPGSTARHNYYELRILPDDFAWILTEELGLQGPYTVCEAGTDGFTRTIQAFRQPSAKDVPTHCKERRQQLLALDDASLEGAVEADIPWVARHRDGFVYKTSV